jgi:O-antigen/teichoic acid export membrane protein
MATYDLKHRFFWNSFNSLWVVGLKILVGMGLTPIIMALLGSKQYGIYVLVIGLMEMALFLDFGFSRTLTRELGASFGGSNSPRAREMLSMGFWFYASLALLVVIAGLLLTPVLLPWFHLMADAGSMRLIVSIAFIIGGLYLYNTLFRVILNAHCLHQWNSVAETINYSLGNLLGVFLVWKGFGLPGFFIARLFTAILMTLFLKRYAHNVEPLLSLPRVKVSAPVAKDVLVVNGHVAIIQLGSILAYNMDVFILSTTLSMTAVAVFDILMKPLTVVFQVIAQIGKGMLPLFSHAWACLDQDGLSQARQYFLSLSTLVNGIGIILLICLGCFYGEVIGFFSSGHFHWQDIIPHFLFAMLATWMTFLQMPATHFLFAWGDQAFLSQSTLGMGVANFLLSFWLVHVYGYLGAILGTVIPQFIQQQVLLIPRACAKLKVSYWEYFRQVHIRMLPLAGFLLFWTLGLRIVVQCYISLSIWMVGLISMSTMLAGLLFYFALLATPAEKAFLSAKFSWLYKKRNPNSPAFEQFPTT